MKAVITQQYIGRKFEVVNDFTTCLPEGIVLTVVGCDGFGEGGDASLVVQPVLHKGKMATFGLMKSWCDDPTILKEIK